MSTAIRALTKDVKSVQRASVDTRHLSLGTPTVEDARIRNDYLMGLRIGACTNIRLYGALREPGSYARAYQYGKHSCYIAQESTLDYLAEPADESQRVEVSHDRIVRGVDSTTTIRNGKSVPRYMRVKLELTNRVSELDAADLPAQHSMTAGSRTFPSATPVFAGKTLPAGHTVHYRVVFWKESDVNLGNMTKVMGGNSQWLHSSVSLDNGSSFRSITGLDLDTLPADMYGAPIAEQGFVIRPNKRRFDDQGRCTVWNERPTARQPACGPAPGSSYQFSRCLDLHASLSTYPISLGNDDRIATAVNWAGQNFKHDAYNPITTKFAGGTVLLDKHFAMRGRVIRGTTDAATDDQVHRDVQLPTTKTVSYTPIKTASAPYRTFSQYLSRLQTELGHEDAQSAVSGARRIDGAVGADTEREFAMNAFTQRGASAGIGVNPPAIYDNGVVGRYLRPSLSTGGSVQGSNGPFVGILNQDQTPDGWDAQDTCYYLPLNHRYNVAVIPYIITPDGLRHSTGEGDLMQYANVSVNCSYVWDNPEDGK
jgi:hypothetical protein